MGNVSSINVSAAQLMETGTTVAGHLEMAARPPGGAVPAPAAASPVDVAAAGAATAIQTRMTAMSGNLATKGPAMQTTTTAAATALQTQDANNASPLKDLASAIPSSGGGTGGSSGGSGGGLSNGKTSMLDSKQQDMYGTPEPPSEAPPPGKVWTFDQTDPITHQGHWEPGEPLHECESGKEFWDVAGIVAAPFPALIDPVPGLIGLVPVEGGLLNDVGQCK